MVDYGDRRRARFVLSDTEAKGADCSVCGRAYDIVAGIDDKLAIAKELDAAFANADSGSADVAGDDSSQDTSKQYLEDWAKPCLSIKDKEAKMDCHSDRLIALSNKLEDDASKGSTVLKYFQKYLKASLRSAFSANFYRIRSGTRMGSIERDEKASEMNDKANEIYEKIIAELQPENGEKTRKDIWAMYRGAFGKQAEHSLNMIRQGYDSGNTQLFQLGSSSLRSLQNELDSLSAVTMDQLADVESENSMEDLYMNTLESPVANYLRDIYQAKDLLSYQLPPLGEDYVRGGTGVADVEDSVVGIRKLEEIIANRARAVRGENSLIQPNGQNIRQGLYLPTGVGSQMMPAQMNGNPMLHNPNMPAGFQQPHHGAAQPISAGQIPQIPRTGGR